MNRQVFPERESKLLEFKEFIPKFEELIKTCIAFANGAGGRLIIGVRDPDRTIQGITEEDRNRMHESFPSSLFDSVQPAIIAQIYEQSFGSQSVLIIEVPTGQRKPYFLKTKGMANGTYIRVGPTTQKATPEYIEDLQREAQRKFYDEEELHEDMDILSKELLTEFFQGRYTKKQLLSEKIIARKPANTEAFLPTVAGTLMFSEHPDRYIPEALIRCTRFDGTAGREILLTEDIEGPLEQQAQQSLTTINRWLTTRFALQGAKLKGKTAIPTEALREAIINALLHRKYNIPGAIKIAVYDNRVEIFSPGSFPGLVDLSTLGDGTTYLTNPNVMRLSYKLHLIETRGTGIRLMFETMKKAGLRAPEYHEEGDFVKVIFYFDPDPMSFPSEDTAIIAFIKKQQIATAAEVSHYLGVSHNSALRKLGKLVKSGEIQKIGKGPSTKYTLSH